MRIAIVYATKYGQTAKIVDRIGSRLEGRGCNVDIRCLGHDTDLATVEIDGVNGVVLGGPIYKGHLPKVLLTWTNGYKGSLKGLPVGFFTVGLNAADSRPKARTEDDRVLKTFCEKASLEPKILVALTGALYYRKYGFITRFLLRRIAAEAGGPTDTSKDHELTDWMQVKDFTDHFLTAARASMVHIVFPT
jgi:menaquinone-dependent protoporphyrinogen oxidase